MENHYPADWQLAKYQIQAEIGRGGMGAVYRGYDALLDRHVAIKILAPHLAWEKEFVERFLREARTAAQLNHPAIVTIYDVGHDQGWYYFVMEYLEGQPLSEMIEEKGPLALEAVIPLLRPLAEALDYAHHQDLVHRDVKPGNIIISPKGSVKLTDFGMARALQRASLTETGTIVGTPKYMSPEQARGKPATAYSDQYSLAVVAYEMLCGQLPFEAESTMALLFRVAHETPTPIRQVHSSLPVGVDTVLKQALDKDPNKRFKTTTDFVEALERALKEPPTQVEAFAQLIEKSPLAIEPDANEAPEPTFKPLVIWRYISIWGWALLTLAILAVLVITLVGNLGRTANSPTVEETATSKIAQETQGPRQTPTPTLPQSPLSTFVSSLIPSATSTLPPSSLPTPPVTNVRAWTRRGPQYNSALGQAPQIFQLAIDPTKPRIVYAGTGQGVYRSTDAGTSWEPRNVGLGDYNGLVITALALDPTNPQLLVVGTWGDGLFRSNDGGTHWTRLTDPLRSASSILSSPAEPEHPSITLGGPSYTYPSPSNKPPTTWQRTAVRCVTINPVVPTEIFACLSDAHGLYQSLDGGSSWSRVDLGQGSAWTFTLAPSNPQIRYASFGPWGQSVSGGLYRTVDGGESWEQVGADAFQSTVIALAISPVNPGVVLAATSRGQLHRSDDGGESWNPIEGEFEGRVIYSLVLAPSNPQVVYIGTERGVYRSGDGGLTWQAVDEDLVAHHLVISPTEPDTVLVGSADFPGGGVYRRAGANSPFSLQADGMENAFVLAVEPDPGEPNVLYAATWGGGLFRSADGGLTWQQSGLEVPYVPNVRAVSGPTGTLLYAGGFYTDQGLFRSQDRGETWVKIGGDKTSAAWLDVLVIEGDPEHLIAATSEGVLYSHDGGADWQPGNLDQAVLKLCAFANGRGLLAATYEGGLFYSREGEAWYEANAGIDALQTDGSLCVYDLACSSEVPGLAFAASRGIYRTTDYGEHWQAVQTGLPDDYFRAVDIAPDSLHVLAGSDQNGIYLNTRGDDTWTALNTGLAELRIRSIQTTGQSPIQIWAGSQGQGIWVYSLIPRSLNMSQYLPLILTSPPSGQAYEPNDSFSRSRFVRLPDTLYSYLSPDSDEDYYRFDIRALGPITVELEGIPAGLDYDLELYDAYQNLAGGSYWPADDPERIVFQPSRTGRYYVRVYSEGGSSQRQPYRLTVSQNTTQQMGQIYGTVTDDGAPATNVPIVLYYDNGYRSVRISTLSDRSGVYRFQGLPSLPTGHTYTIVYPNYERSEQRLALWHCQSITAYQQGQELEACSFDVANITAQSPAHQAVVTLPATFTWQKREETDRGYQLRLRSTVGDWLWASDIQADTDTFTLTDMPAELRHDELCRWDILIYSEDGYGVAYYYREVTFSPTASEVKGFGPGEPNYPRGLRGAPPVYPQTEKSE